MPFLGMNTAGHGIRYFFMWLLLSIINLTMTSYNKMISCFAGDVAGAQGLLYTRLYNKAKAKEI